MGIFDGIRDAIFGKANAAPAQPTTRPSTTATPQAPASTTASAEAPAAPSPQATVDVSAVLEKAVAGKKQKLNWRKSIVDLMKALDLDSGLEARKRLAKELNYTGDTKDSAKMNVWLHKALMKKLAENGGKVPADLLD
ncbi:DUF3597 domain-containing protein [Taklimakanibacter deserti]|uniref:DUF3597 domain-containing protein n=1 Tax=Taklimakanibacter deserti TaxID=2267839 RepID=UPI000E651E64